LGPGIYRILKPEDPWAVEFECREDSILRAWIP